MFDYEYWGTNTLAIKQNMALEEYLLKRSAEKNVATIRFWNVDKDSAVIGYGESSQNIKNIDGSFDIARRITGGSHVQFDKSCLAYTFTAPRDGSFKHFDDMRKYFAEYISDSLTDIGIKDTYADNRSSTINIDGKVVASHAMFWGVDSALMHGLILVDHYDVEKIYNRMLLNERKIGRNTYSEYHALREAPAVMDLAAPQTAIKDHDAKAAYVKGMLASKILSKITSSKYKGMDVSANVLSDSERLVLKNHTDQRWFEQRTPPYEKSEVEAIPGEELNGVLKKNLGYCMYIEVGDKAFSQMSIPKEETENL